MSIIIGYSTNLVCTFILLVIHISLYLNFRSNSKESNYINIKLYDYELDDMLNNHFMVQLNNTATRENNILDLVITNIPELVNISEVLSPAEGEIFTDHSIINFDLLVHPKRLPRINRTVYDYWRGDFTALRSALDSLDLSGLITTNGDINDDWRNWKDTFLATVSNHIPTAKLRSQRNVSWMNSAMIHNIN